MHTKIFYLILALIVCWVSQSTIFPQQPDNQDNSGDKWIRVQSDDGEFSLEVPADYKYFFNKDGFSVSKDSANYQLTNMRMLNSFHNGTTLSLEIYAAKKGALDSIYEQEIYNKKEIEKSTIRRNGFAIRQVVIQTEKFYLIEQYFSSKTNIYVLTAVSRKTETPDMRRFLDSLVFKPNTKDGPAPNAHLLSTLPVTEVAVEQQDKPATTVQAPAGPPPPKDENIIPVTIASKPRASYVDKARLNFVMGSILIKTTLSVDAFIPKIVVIGKALPDGLLRQALFAAMRIKFLPKENHGVPETTVVTIEYSFDIY